MLGQGLQLAIKEWLLVQELASASRLRLQLRQLRQFAASAFAAIAAMQLSM